MNSIKTLVCALAIALINSQAGAQNSVAPPSAGRTAMLIASAGNPQKPAVSLGSTVWSLIPPAPNQPATDAVQKDSMSKDAMSKDSMKKDNMKTDAMKDDSMKTDAMKKN
jgi:pentapeptide MXKDX repeat protein